jgi:hypothetical protein
VVPKVTVVVPVVAAPNDEALVYIVSARAGLQAITPQHARRAKRNFIIRYLSYFKKEIVRQAQRP